MWPRPIATINFQMEFSVQLLSYIRRPDETANPDSEAGSEVESPTLSEIIARNNAWQLLPAKGTGPCVFYIG